jgi:signal peptidase I
LSFEPANRRDWSSGDRVLVGKYEYHIRSPQRFDVPVFKFPEEPYHSDELTAMNYIKRLVGLPGETIAIYKGDLYRTTSLKYSNRNRPENKKDEWRLRWPLPVSQADRDEPGAMEIANERLRLIYIPSKDYTYTNDPDALQLFSSGGFEPIRKTPDEILAMRKLVFDLDKQPKSLTGVARTRWHATSTDNGWREDGAGFRFEGPNLGWLRYHHVAPGWEKNKNPPNQPAEITDQLAYNSTMRGLYWMPDLLVECRAEFKSEADELTLELTKAGDKYQAVFANGKCKLVRIAAASPSSPEVLAEQPTKITSGRHDVRFANFDSRLTVWVDGDPLDFGAAADYPPPNREKFERSTADLEEPARIGGKGNIVISKVQLWRDLYYSTNDAPWVPRPGQVETHYVQPGHYFCLGDNSASSADGRSWGLVPDRLMLGRAVVIYWPISRIRVIK